MKNKTIKLPSLERMLGVVGLVFIVLIAWATNQDTKKHGRLTRPRRVLGWLAIESITAIGWALDRIAPVDAGAETRGLADPRPAMHGEQR
jgi:hypothetical protein